MKVKNTPEIAKKLEGLMEIGMLNAAMSQVLLAGADGVDEAEIQAISSYGKRFQQQAGMQGELCTEDEALIGGLIAYLYQKTGQWDYIDSRIMGPVLKEASLFPGNFLAGNPYFAKIQLPIGQQIGDCLLARLAFDKYELFPYNEATVVDPLLIIPKLAVATEAFAVPALLRNNEIVDVITPQRAFGLEPYIKSAVGKVLILGGGLGYLAYRLVDNPKVESITIVEKDKDVFQFLKKDIVSQFGTNSSKIKLVLADGFDYVQDLQDGAYDYCLVDIWRDSQDILAYMKMKQAMKKFKAMPVAFCLEDSLVEAVLVYVFTIMYQQLAKGKYHKLPALQERESSYLQTLLAKVEINSPEDVDYYLNKANLAKLLAE